MSARHFSFVTPRSKFFQLLLLPVALLSKIIPKEKGLSVYGSLHGTDITDNSKYNYLNNPSNRKFFIVRGNVKLKRKTLKEFNALYCYSPRGIFYQLRAEKVFYTHTIYDLIPALIWGSKIINLWHGVPVYKKLYAVKKNFLYKIFYHVFSYIHPYHFSFVHLSKRDMTKDYIEMFNISHNKIIYTPQDKNVFFNQKNIKKWEGKNILYAPTHRSAYDDYPFDPKMYQNFLEFLDARLNKTSKEFNLFFKPHPIDFNKVSKEKYFLFETDLNKILGDFSLVITDFSSVYFDCIERNIPVLLFAMDANFFINNKTIEITDGYIKNQLIQSTDNLLKNIQSSMES